MPSTRSPPARNATISSSLPDRRLRVSAGRNHDDGMPRSWARWRMARSSALVGELVSTARLRLAHLHVSVAAPSSLPCRHRVVRHRAAPSPRLQPGRVVEHVDPGPDPTERRQRSAVRPAGVTASSIGIYTARRQDTRRTPHRSRLIGEEQPHAAPETIDRAARACSDLRVRGAVPCAGSKRGVIRYALPHACPLPGPVPASASSFPRVAGAVSSARAWPARPGTSICSRIFVKVREHHEVVRR